MIERWFVEVESGGVIAVKDADDREICRLWDDEPEAISLAQRISATPDLLAACEAVVMSRALQRACVDPPPRTEIDEMLESAIAKAKGEER